ncbi:MAG: M28 family peptidase [Chthoniobacterales bacterium]
MRRPLFSALRVTGALAAIALVTWWFMIRMPGQNVRRAAALSDDEVALRTELKADVQTLAGDIGERNLPRYPSLIAAAEYIEKSFTKAGLTPRRDTFELRGRACHNIEAEIAGSSPDIVVVAAHYDSIYGAPGANDNGSGAAAVLALARRFASHHPRTTLRFVEFVNEEPPYFQTAEMGSLVYAGRCKARGDQIVAMISLETIGYFSDVPRSQVYPSLGLGAFYPKTANFIAFVSNLGSRHLLKRCLTTFRGTQKLPSEGGVVPSFIPGIGWSDHWAFWQHGYPAIMVTDTAPFRYPHYHQPSDTPDKLDYDRFALVVSGMQNVIADLIEKP